MIDINESRAFGWPAAVRGMRNPMNSWARSDSSWAFIDKPLPEGEVTERDSYFGYVVGPNDRELMMKLSAGGPVHGKFKRMILVTCDITAPLYWWKEFDTYKVGTVANSCSTMHKIQDKEFTLDDFSCEHLMNISDPDIIAPGIPGDRRYGCVWYNEGVFSPYGCLDLTIKLLNEYRKMFLATGKKQFWWQMIQLLPSSYNQKRTVMLNYEVLTNIYQNRKNHKLDEWRKFCDFMAENLPMSELFTGIKEE